MKNYSKTIMVLFFCILSANIFSQKTDPDYYQKEINNFVFSFQANCFDSDKLRQIHNTIEDLIDEINIAIESSNISNYTKNDLISLRKRAKNIENAFTAICLPGFKCNDKSSFTTGATDLGFTMSYPFSGKYCIEIMKVEYGSFFGYLAESSSNSMVGIVAKFNLPNGLFAGSMETNFFPKDIGYLYTNSGHKEIKNIKIASITCK